jgi:lipopolysaccharide biosynthesis glycosyltransferase
MTVDIVFCLNRKVLRAMIAAMNSIVSNAAQPEALRFHIAVPDLEEEARAIRAGVAAAFPDPAFSWSTAAVRAPDWIADYIEGRAGGGLDDEALARKAMQYARCYLPEMFPGLGKFIYFDCDVIVRDDVARLWEEAGLSEAAPFAAAPQLYTGVLYFARPLKGLREGLSILRPFNSGMFVTDARAWKGPVTDRIRRYLDWNAAHGYTLFSLQDEPVLNLVFKDYLRLSPRWNRCGYGNHPFVARLLKRPLSEMSVIHWSGGHRKPWRDRTIAYAEEWWAYDKGPVAA